MIFDLTALTLLQARMCACPCGELEYDEGSYVEGRMRMIIRLVWIAALLGTPRAMGDGMVFRQLGSSADVRATDQRAVMWLRDGTWEIHIQPVFDRAAGAAAWVVPFPVRPEVHEGSADFIDELEFLTSPVFIETCWESHESGCIWIKAGDTSLGQASQAQAWVDVWERGEVGELDYAILSATGGDDLVDWMVLEGFEVPSGAETLIAGYETEGVFFFVARLREEADPLVPLTPVRFVLSGMETPTYPLRLTGLGLAAGTELSLTLWVLYSTSIDEDGWFPASHSAGELPESPEDIGEFDEMRESFHSAAGGDDLLVRSTFSGDEVWYMLDSESFCLEPWFTDTCVPFSEVGVDAPQEWSDEIMLVASSRSCIHRYEGWLDAEQLSRDLTLGQVHSWALPWATSVYQVSRGECGEKPGCSVSGQKEPSGPWILALLVLLGLGARLVASQGRDHETR